jgi:hypothetical protein
MCFNRRPPSYKGVGFFMHFRLDRALALVSLLCATLLPPASVSADQPSVVLITLVDGTACRGPITGTTFTMVNARATYACTDGRWILGEPFSLADGRQTAMLARTVLQGQPLHDDVICTDSQCPTALEQVEVATAASLPRVVNYAVTAQGPSVTCTFQYNPTFYLGGVRANYLCDPSFFQDRQRAGGYWIPEGAEPTEYWILGGLYDSGMGGGLQGTVVRIQHRGTQIGVGGNNRAQYPVMCNNEVCVMATYQTTFGGVGPAS